MPPRKKSRVPPSPLDSESLNLNVSIVTPSTPGPSSASGPQQLAGEPVYSDAWTDEQEITLFKAIAVYRWKPAGMCKPLSRIQNNSKYSSSSTYMSVEGKTKKGKREKRGKGEKGKRGKGKKKIAF